MKLASLVCDVCASPDLHAVAPGHKAASCDLFALLPEVPARGWCLPCWADRVGAVVSADCSHAEIKIEKESHDERA